MRNEVILGQKKETYIENGLTFHGKGSVLSDAFISIHYNLRFALLLLRNIL